jgi:PAS domain S-box-containing protein
LYRILFEKATLPVLIIDAQGRILFANRGFEHLLGYAPGECLDLYLQDFCLPYERDRFIFSNLGKLAETIELDLDLKDKAGQSITANIILSPFERRTRPHLLLIFRDVTGKRTQEGQLRDSEERYRRLLAERDNLEAQLKRSIKLACLGELAAGIAHEVNNPLSIILGFSQDILDEINQDHPLWESIKIIEQETARCVGVVQNLLELARPNPPQVMEVNLAQLVEDTVGLLLPRLKNNKIQVAYDLDANLPPLRLDPQMIQQALLNLMINAIQSMPLGGELNLGLRNTAESDDPWVRIAIGDTGHGIAPAHMQRVFEPFFSTKGSKGTGLGLAISQRIVENHGGRIEIASQEGAGTICTVLLPRA